MENLVLSKKSAAYPVFKKMSLELPIQTTTFTCGPMALVTTSRLLGEEATEAVLAGELQSCTKCGTDNDSILSWATKNLPVKNHGCGVYEGGFGIANILNPFSGRGHYVTLLGKQNGFIRYYCSSVGQVVTIHEDSLNWMDGTGTKEEWVINLEQAENMFDFSIHGENKATLVNPYS